MVPNLLPSRRPLKIFLLVTRHLPCRNLAQRKIIQTVLNSPRSTAGISVLGNIYDYDNGLVHIQGILNKKNF